jgi:Gpi18-like mannosyltransferase
VSVDDDDAANRLAAHSMTIDCPINSPSVSSDNAAARASRTLFSQAFWGDIALPFVATRIAMLVIAFVGTKLFAAPGDSPPRWLDVFSRFDGLWYLKIARDGYFFDPSRQSSIAFAPLFPMLMRLVGGVFGSSDAAFVMAGILISIFSLLVALIFICATTRELFGDRAARRTAWYVLICPGTLYLSAVYPMSLMVAIGAASLWYARHERWRLACAIGMLAPLARPDGILLLFPLFLEAGRSKQVYRRHLCLLVIPLMSGVWLGAQWIAFGTPLAFIEAQKMWEPSPFITVVHSSRAVLILGIAAFFVLLTVLGWFRLPMSFSLYSSLFLMVMLTSGRLWSLPRFVVILFPCFMLLAQLGTRWKWLHVFYIVSAALLAAIFALRFSLGLWVA